MSNGLVEIFKHRGRTCVIAKLDRGYPTGAYHNGYVSTRLSNHGISYEKLYDKIDADAPTYAGDLVHYDGIPDDLWFIGFDSVHVWNDAQPESKTHLSVKERTIKFADDMIRSRI